MSLLGNISLSKPSPLLRNILISTLIVALIVGVMIWFDWHREVIRLLQWLNDQGPLVSLMFILIMALVVVLLLPGVFFTTGAGFVFGVVEGTLYVVIGTTLGAVIAFLIARNFFGERAARWITKRAKIHIVTQELSKQGWKIIMLSRLVPFFPFKLSNYFFGLTPVSLRDFALGTLIGLIPFSLHNVYLGAMAAMGLQADNVSGWQWLLYGLGFLATIALVYYLNRIAKQALAKITEPEENT